MHNGKGILARRIFENVAASRRPLEGYEHITCFSDLETVNNREQMSELLHANKLFKEFDAAYPDALFIYNVRNFDNWVVSRFNHNGGDYAKLYLTKLRHRAQNEGLDVTDLVSTWKSDWFAHQRAVREYFGNSTRFLEFNIEKDPVEHLANFLERHSYRISSKFLPHRKNTKKNQYKKERSWKFLFLK